MVPNALAEPSPLRSFVWGCGRRARGAPLFALRVRKRTNALLRGAFVRPSDDDVEGDEVLAGARG